MALVSMRELLDHAAVQGYGIPAFNVNNLEQVQAVMAAAHETGAPVILQASAGARKYAGESFIKHLIQAAVEAYPHIPLVMHQDHGQNPGVRQGIELCTFDKICGLFWVSQQLFARHSGVGTVSVFFVSLHGF